MARVLLVDDERGLRTTLRAFLELDGYEVQVAESGMQALDLLALNGPVDVVVSDIILPKMTGVELLREIKVLYPKTRVILITGEPTIATATTAVRSGAFDYLDKPITKERILQVVRAAVAAGPAGGGSSKVSDSEIEPAIYRNIDQLPDVLWEMDLNFRYTYISPAIERLRGYSIEESMAQTPRETMTPESAALIEEILQEELMLDLEEKAPNRRIRNIELDLRHYDGTLVPVEVAVTFLRDDAGKPIGIMGITRDISARRQSQRRNQENLSISERLRRMQSMARLAGGIAHDFNNLLTSVSGNVALAMMDAEGNQAVMESLEEIKKVASRANELTSKLLEFSQRQTLSLVLTDIGNLLVNVRQKYEELLGRGRRLIVQLPDDIHRAKVDPIRLEASLHELVRNAADAIEPGGTVTIGVTAIFVDDELAHYLSLPHAGEYVVLAVRDTGHGIEAKDLPLVFEPYFSTKPKGKGKGIGLARVYGNIRQMGGGLNIVSEPGLGTTVELYLPREFGDEPVEVARQAERDEPRILTGTETILCVDDDDIVRDMTVRTLRRHGYHVLEAANGLEAVQLAEVFHQPIHLLLTDLVMPKLGGEGCAKGVVALKPDTRVLFTSGFTEKAIDFNKKSPVEFLPKPYDAHTLVVAVRRVLDK